MTSLVKRIALFAAAALLAVSPVVHARLPAPQGAPLADHGAKVIQVPMRNAEASKMIGRMLNEPGFWEGARRWQYDNQLYDTIQLKEVPGGGFLPMISGESDQDIPHDVVADIVFGQQTALPAYMDGCVAVHTLGYGTDPEFGVPYLDNLFVLDFSFFYVQYMQRMYKKRQGDKTYLWFEKLDERFVDAATWADYQRQKKEVMDGLDLRNFFGSVLDVGEIYGIFVVGKGTRRESRVTFVSRISFDSDAGWLARLGSKMPPVIKAGLQSGFDASVKIAKAERDRRKG